MVIYCDLDNFKAFNDKYGIAKGDQAIKLTADIFKAI
jgi:diguanylate cyclase (GGDEF)-like protein